MLKPLFLLFITTYATASKILVVVPIPSRSHVILFESLVAELGKRGHQVTYISAHNLPKPAPNVTEIVVNTQITGPDGKALDFLSIKDMTPLDNVLALVNLGLQVTEMLLKDQTFQEFLKRKPQFDLLLSEAFLSEGLMSGLSRYFNVPNIGYATFMPSYWTNYMVGNVAPTSHIPDPLLGHPYRMNFRERLENFVFTTFAEFYQKTIYMPKQDALMRRYFGNDHPYVADIIKNTSLLLINDHFSTSFPRPSVPNMVGIAGVHVRPPKPLPTELKNYLDNSKDGAILFSLGSNIKAALLPEAKVRMFLNAFAKLKENVLWKFETDLADIPKNVKISKWLPQSDILAHPNIKLFITHGGLLSTTEATDRGVPIVGIPVFGDQPMNMRQSVSQGVGLSIKFDDLSEERILAAVKQVLQNPKYREASKLRSAQYHDRAVAPMDLAIFWIEYVIRHDGAPHLRAAVQDLCWFQQNQLDIIGLLAAVSFIVLYTIKLIISRLCKLVCGSKNIDKKKKRN